MGQRSIRFPDELEQRVLARAAADDRSFSYVVLRALEKALGSGVSITPGKGPDGGPSKRAEIDPPLTGPPTPAPSRTSVKNLRENSRGEIVKDDASEAAEFALPKISEDLPRFKCRSCEFSAPSSKARCPHHGGALVPA